MKSLYETYEKLKEELKIQQEINSEDPIINEITQKIQRIEEEIMGLNGLKP